VLSDCPVHVVLDAVCSAKIICVLKTQAFQSELREICQPPERSQ